MNQSQIEHFMTLALYNSFSEAAEKLYISQPALSKSISSLEKELDVELFHRGYRNITLTMAGERYYAFFHKVLNEFYELNTDIHSVNFYRKKTIHMGILDGVRAPELSKTVREFIRSEKDTVILFNYYSIEQIMEQFEHDKVDIMIGFDFIPGFNTNYNFSILEETPILLYYNSLYIDNPSLYTFREEEYLYVHHHLSQTAIMVQKYFWNILGYEPPKQKPLDSFDAMFMELECGGGFCVMAATSMNPQSKDIVGIDLGYKSNLLAVCKDKQFLPDLKKLKDIHSIFMK